MAKIPFIAVFLREIDRVAGRSSTRNLLFWVPLTVYFFLAFIYIRGGLHSIPVAVYDADNSSLSRTFVRYLDASKNMQVDEYLTSDDNIGNYFLNHPDIQAVFVLPKDMYKDILKGKKVQVTIFTNSTNIVFGNILKREALTISTTVSSGVLLERFKAAGLTHHQAMNLTMPITVHSKALYNPYYNYLYYLIPGLLTVLLQMIIFFVSTRALNSEFQEGTFDKLFDISGGSIANILFGKALAYSLFGMIITVLITGVIFTTFGIPVKGDMTKLYLLFFLFITANIFLGFMISSIFEDQILSLDIAFFYNSPAFVFSGFTFPRLGMPAFDNFYADLIPYSHFMTAFFKIYQMDVPSFYLRPEIIALLVFLIAGLTASYTALKIKLKLKERKLKTANG